MARADISSFHISVAAEAFAAGLFAQCGLDVSVQYGANQPEYDLVVVKGDRVLKVSVKGSQTGSWGLTQSYLKDANYHAAADAWLRRHKSRTVICLVQFKGVTLGEAPRIYLATPKDIATRLKETAKGHGDTTLYENHRWTARAIGAGSVDLLPAEWRFSKKRVEQLLDEA
jgi:Holliday junction resolvase-like predicted endonuclease